MAANLKKFAMAGNFAWLMLLGGIPVLVFAEELTDPTRPPSRPAAHAGTAEAAGNELQSVIISPNRRAAIIQGQTVELGGKVGDFRLIEVNETGVVLQGVKGLEVLPLFPSVKVNRKAMILPPRNDSARKAGTVVKPVGNVGAEEEK